MEIPKFEVIDELDSQIVVQWTQRVDQTDIKLFQEGLKAFELSCISSSISKVATILLKIGINDTLLVPAAVEEGFRFHHTKPSYIMMSKTLLTTSKKKGAGYGGHYIGCGGVVFREDTQEILVIKEKKGFFTKYWKLPGGRVEEHETIGEGGTREVFEETGIKTDASNAGILGFRETVQSYYGLSDLYFVLLLKPLSYDINIDTREVKEARWMPIQEFISQPIKQQMFQTMASLLKMALIDTSVGIELLGKNKDRVNLTCVKYQMKVFGKVFDDIFYCPDIIKVFDGPQPQL